MTLALAQDMPHQQSILMNPVLPLTAVSTNAPATVVVHQGDPFFFIGEFPKGATLHYLSWKIPVKRQYARHFLAHIQLLFSSPDSQDVMPPKRPFSMLYTFFSHVLRYALFCILVPLYCVRVVYHIFIQFFNIVRGR